MSDEQATQTLYNRQEEEPGIWYARFLLYRNMGHARSLLGAVHREEAEKGRERQSEKVPGSWNRSADRWQWKKRAEQYDADQQSQAEERRRVIAAIEQAEIERIMTSDYALIHKRIEGLNRTAQLVEASFLEKDKETGEEKINFAWVTPDKIREYRGCLDDIAKELGQRVKKTELTGKNGTPLEGQRNSDLSRLTDDELDLLHNLLLRAIERRENGTSTL